MSGSASERKMITGGCVIFWFMRFLSSERKRGGRLRHLLPVALPVLQPRDYGRGLSLFIVLADFSLINIKFLTFHFWRIPRLRNPPLLSQCENLPVVKGFTSQNCFLVRGFMVCVDCGTIRENASRFGSQGEYISLRVTYCECWRTHLRVVYRRMHLRSPSSRVELITMWSLPLLAPSPR